MDIGHVTWRRSSYTGANGGNCVEVGVWSKASHSGANGGGCVEVMRTPAAVVAVRDSKDPGGPKLAFTPTDWRQFIYEIKHGHLSRA